MENIVIIGAGPAGISAALYAARGNMNPLVINNGIGALEKAEKIENYYGLEQPLSGKELYERGIAQAKALAAIVYKATWPDEKKFVCTVGTLAQTAAENNITKTALMIIGDSVKAAQYDRSKLYDPGFTTEFREATK